MEGRFDYFTVMPLSGNLRPDWRYLLSGRPPDEVIPEVISDEWVARLRRHQGLDCAQPEPDRDIAEAWRLQFQESPDERSYLRALLLTDEPLDVIAARSGLSTGAVTAFVTCFFDVRERLRARDWILLRVIRVEKDLILRSWLATAYCVGRFALDVVAAATRNKPFPPAPDGSHLDSPSQKTLRLKVELAISVDSVPDAQIPTLVDLYCRLRAQEAKTDPKLAAELKKLRLQAEVFRVAGAARPPAGEHFDLKGRAAEAPGPRQRRQTRPREADLVPAEVVK